MNIAECAGAVFIHFLTGRAEEAANEWAEAVRKAHGGGERDARLQMDIDFARDHYRTVRDRLAEARAAKAMDAMQLGPVIEIIDMAWLPGFQGREPGHDSIRGGGWRDQYRPSPQFSDRPIPGGQTAKRVECLMRITRGHWLALGALAGTAIAAAIVDFQWEETYRSETLVRLKTPPAVGGGSARDSK